MAKVYVTCYRYLARDNTNMLIAAPEVPPLAEMVVEISPDSTQSDPFPRDTTFICVKTDGTCALAFGEDPKAESDKHMVDAGERLWYGVKAGHKVAVISI